MSPGEGNKAYQVLKIDQLVRPSATGGIEYYYRHTIMTRGGTRISVDISEADFTPEKVKPILTKAATNADEILTS